MAKDLEESDRSLDGLFGLLEPTDFTNEWDAEGRPLFEPLLVLYDEVVKRGITPNAIAAEMERQHRRDNRGAKDLAMSAPKLRSFIAWVDDHSPKYRLVSRPSTATKNGPQEYDHLFAFFTYEAMWNLFRGQFYFALADVADLKGAIAMQGPAPAAELHRLFREATNTTRLAQYVEKRFARHATTAPIPEGMTDLLAMKLLGMIDVIVDDVALAAEATRHFDIDQHIKGIWSTPLSEVFDRLCRGRRQER